MVSLAPDLGRRELTLVDKVRGIQWGLVLLIALLGSTMTTLPQAFTHNDYVFTAERFAVGLFGIDVPLAKREFFRVRRPTE